MEAILEIRDLTKQFPAGKQAALTAVHMEALRLFPGESLGIVGESGCGKSTLARLICRLYDATSGSIYLHGQDITRVRGRELREVYRRIQMVFQSPEGSFDPRKTIGYSVGESLANRGMPGAERKRRVAGLLARCGLPETFAGRYPHELSGGQCQRAAIARALAVGPEVLVCDEVTSALDMAAQKQVMDLLTELKRERGISLLFICHNLALVQSFCDRVLVMHAGTVVEEGTPDQVIASPQCAYTKQLVDAAEFSLLR